MKRFILLVEDNPDDATLALRAFRKSNLNRDIVTVQDGVEALDFLFGRGAFAGRDTRALPDVILLDIKLPKLDGLEILKRLRADEHTCLIPVVMLTTSQEKEDLVRSYKLGANSYIRKPVDFNRFFEVMNQVGSYWLVLNQTVYGS
jgi:two-component system response regulator